MKNESEVIRHLTKTQRQLIEAKIQWLEQTGYAEKLRKYRGTLAGGFWVDALEGRSAKDLDLYFPSVEHANNFYLDLKQIPHPLPEDVPLGKNNLRFRNLEIMRFVVFESPQEVINNFDLSCCQIAWDGSMMYYGEHTIEDINAKYLRLLQVNASLEFQLKRILKYIHKGYQPDVATFGSLCKWLKTNPDTPLVFEQYEKENAAAVPPPPRAREVPRFNWQRDDELRQRGLREPAAFIPVPAGQDEVIRDRFINIALAAALNVW